MAMCALAYGFDVVMFSHTAVLAYDYFDTNGRLCWPRYHPLVLVVLACDAYCDSKVAEHRSDFLKTHKSTTL